MLSFLLLLCVGVCLASVCFREGTSIADDDVTEGKECVGPCMSCELTLFGDDVLWFTSGCGVGPVEFFDIVPDSHEGLFPMATVEDVTLDVCEGLGFKDVKELTCTEDLELILNTYIPKKFHDVIPTALSLIESGNACCCPSNLCNSVPVSLPQPRVECYQSTKSDQNDQSQLHYICPGTTCMTCEIVTIGQSESAAQGCGSGPFVLSNLVPSDSALLGFDIQEAILDEACANLGLGDVDELTCIDDPEKILRAAPERIQSLIPQMLQLIESLRVCCCGSSFCNRVPTPTPPPSIDCYQSSKNDQNDHNSVQGSCPGNTCMTCEIVAIEHTEVSSAQGCGSGPFVLSNLVPSDSALLGFDIQEAILDEACANLGLGDVDQLMCIDDPEKILRAGPEHIQPLVPQMLVLIKSLRICCCGKSLCNTVPTPTPTPAAITGNKCFYNVKSIPPLADTEIRDCPGPCMSCQIITNDPIEAQEFSSQGCGSGVLPLANIVPPQALLYETVVDETVTDPCALLQFKGQGIVCLDSPKDILKAFLPPRVLQRAANFREFVRRIDRMRVCCCVGDHCNGPLTLF